MPRNPRNPKLAAGLSVLSIALKVSSEATSGIPIVNEILKTAAHIVNLAEQADRNADQLYFLADEAATLAQDIKRTLDGRELSVRLQVPLNRLLEVFVSIEKFMESHRRLGKFKRAFSYLFTVSKHVDRLNDELRAAKSQFELSVKLDTSVAVAQTLKRLDDSARYDSHGSRVIRHSDVHKVAMAVGEIWMNGQVVRYDKIRIKGEAMVVQYYDERQSKIPEEDAESDSDEYPDMRTSIAEHLAVLKKISTVELSHPNVVQLYGLSVGTVPYRAAFLRAGSIPYYKYQETSKSMLQVHQRGVHIGWKVLNALAHLDAYCDLTCEPWFEYPSVSVMIRDDGEPTIGQKVNSLVSTTIFDDLTARVDYYGSIVRQLRSVMLEPGLEHFPDGFGKNSKKYLGRFVPEYYTRTRDAIIKLGAVYPVDYSCVRLTNLKVNSPTIQQNIAYLDKWASLGLPSPDDKVPGGADFVEVLRVLMGSITLSGNRFYLVYEQLPAGDHIVGSYRKYASGYVENGNFEMDIPDDARARFRQFFLSSEPDKDNWRTRLVIENTVHPPEPIDLDRCGVIEYCSLGGVHFQRSLVCDISQTPHEPEP